MACLTININFSTEKNTNVLTEELDGISLWWFRIVVSTDRSKWIFVGRTDAEAKAPILWATWCEKQTQWKGSEAGKDWRQEEKGVTGWDGWMASPIQWIQTWANSGRRWGTGEPGMMSPWHGGHQEWDTT